MVLVNGEELEKGVGSCAPAVTPYQIDEAVACTTLAAATNAGDTFLCATLAEKILVLQYDFRQGAFVIRKVSSLHTAFLLPCTFIVHSRMVRRPVGRPSCLLKHPPGPRPIRIRLV